MARSRGIPARVVSGYRGGDFSPVDRSYTIRASMAHLWVEAYLNGVGWVRFDPSPQEDFGMGRFGTLRAALSRQVLRGKMFWYQSVMGFQGGWRLDRLIGSGKLPKFSDITGSGTAVIRSVPQHAAVLIPAGVAAVLLLALAGMLRGRNRDRRFPLTPDQARAVRLRRALIKRMERLGIPCSGRVVEEIADLARSCAWLDNRPVLKIVAAYNAVRFGGRPMNRAQYAALRRELAGVRLLR